MPPAPAAPRCSKDGKATFDSEQGKQVATMFQTLYKENLASKEAYKGDSFAEGKAGCRWLDRGPSPRTKGKVNWGAVPVPGAQAQAAGSTFSRREERRDVLRLQEPRAPRGRS